MTSFGRALRGVALVVVALLGLAAAGLWALSRREPRTVGLAVTGTIEARDVDLSAKTTARIAAILVEGRVTEVASGAEFTPRNVQTQKERVNLVFRVRVAIANPDGRLKPGMPADAVIATD
jgi:hypothetical protein